MSKREIGLLVALLLQLILLDAGVGLTIPVLPLYAGRLGANTALIGLVVGFVGISRVLLDLPAGVLADRWGRRRLLLLGPALVFGGALLAAVAPNFWVLLPARFLEGAGTAFGNTVVMVALVDIVRDKPNRGRIMSLYQGARRGSNGLGPVLGGLLADAWGYRAVYLVYAGLAAASFSWSYFQVPRFWRNAPVRRQTAGAELPRSFYLSRDFLLVASLAFIFFFARLSSRRLILPLLGHRLLGLSGAGIGLALSLGTVTNLVVLLASGHLTDRWGPKRVIVLGNFLAGLAFLAYAFSTTVPRFYLSSLFWGVASGLGGTSRNVYLMDVAPPHGYGRAMGAYRTIGDIGFLLGPMVMGLGLGSLGFRRALLIGAGLFLASSIYFQLLARRFPPRRAAEVPLGEPTD